MIGATISRNEGKMRRQRTEKRVEKRVNLYMVAETSDRLEHLAQLNERSRSNMISVLINREFERVEEAK